MNRKKIVAVIAIVSLLALVFIVFALHIPQPKVSFSQGNLSLSTNKTSIYQKAPYPVIDFFRYHEEVTLVANASQSGSPLSESLVSFQVTGPSNVYENISFSETAITDNRGVGKIDFRVPSPVEDHWETIFGNWTVTAQTQEDGSVYKGTRIFRVNWPVEILSLRTVDANRASRISFVKEGDVGVEVTLRNNNAVPAIVNVRGVAYDNLTTPVGRFELLGLEVPPGMKSTIYCRLALSDEVVIFSGPAKLSVSLFDENNNPYCLPAYTYFSLWQFGYPPLTILPEDVTVVDLSLSSNEVDVGTAVDVSAILRNNDDEIQDLTVVLYDNNFPVLVQKGISLLPRSEGTLHLVLNTAGEFGGNHSIRALAISVPWETHLADNTSPTRNLTLSIHTPTSGNDEFPRSLFLILLLILLLFLATLTAVVVYRRKKKPFDSGDYTFFLSAAKLRNQNLPHFLAASA